MLKLTQSFTMGEPQFIKAGLMLNDHGENKKEKGFYVTQTARTLKQMAVRTPYWHIHKTSVPLRVFNNS